MEEIPREDVDKFLKGLFDLSIKYNIEIAGCGCCGSPFLMKIRKYKGTPVRYKVLEDNDFLEIVYEQ